MFAVTERLLLRPAWPEDAPALARAIAHEGVVRMTGRVPWPYREADADAFIAQASDSNLLILRRDGGVPQLIGGIGLTSTGRADERELGYWLTPAAWGRGFATEAGRAVMDMARHALGLRRVHAGHFVDNPASARVLQKLGFRPTGRIEPRPSLGRGGEAMTLVSECVLVEAEEPVRAAA